MYGTITEDMYSENLELYCLRLLCAILYIANAEVKGESE